MKNRMEIAFFGPSPAASGWDRGPESCRALVGALHQLGHQVIYLEPDPDGRSGGPNPDPSPASLGLRHALEEAGRADVVVRAVLGDSSGRWLEAAVLAQARPEALTVLYDLDPPATLARLQRDAGDPLRLLLPAFHLVLVRGGHAATVRAYLELGARHCVTLHEAADPARHYPVPRLRRFSVDLMLAAPRTAQLAERMAEFWLGAARRLPDRSFLLAGPGWGDVELPANGCWIGPLLAQDANSLAVSPRTTLELSRPDQPGQGPTPTARLFEVALAGGCLITDRWPGVEQFFEPDLELLIADGGAELAALLGGLDEQRAQSLGQAALRHAQAHHTWARRAAALETLLRTGESRPEDGVGLPGPELAHWPPSRVALRTPELHDDRGVSSSGG